MRRTPQAKNERAAPRRHSLRVVFLAVRRRALRPCSRMQSVPTAPSLRRSHFGRDFEGRACCRRVETVATLVPDGMWFEAGATPPLAGRAVTNALNLLPLSEDTVAKVRNRPMIILPPKDDPTNDRRSLQPQTRYRGRP